MSSTESLLTILSSWYRELFNLLCSFSRLYSLWNSSINTQEVVLVYDDIREIRRVLLFFSPLSKAEFRPIINLEILDLCKVVPFCLGAPLQSGVSPPPSFSKQFFMEKKLSCFALIRNINKGALHQPVPLIWWKESGGISGGKPLLNWNCFLE